LNRWNRALEIVCMTTPRAADVMNAIARASTSCTAFQSGTPLTPNVGEATSNSTTIHSST